MAGAVPELHAMILAGGLKDRPAGPFGMRVIGAFDSGHGDDMSGIVEKIAAVHCHRCNPLTFTISEQLKRIVHALSVRCRTVQGSIWKGPTSKLMGPWGVGAHRGRRAFTSSACALLCPPTRGKHM